MRGVGGIDGEAVGGGDLLLGRAGDRPEKRADGVDRLRDLVHARDQGGRVRLQGRDLALDVLGRGLGLHRERFHFRRDHRKAAAGFARPRRLDGGVEREQVGLLRNRRDQVDDGADIGRGRLQAIDPRGRGRGQFGDIARQAVGLARRMADFGGGLREFLGRLSETAGNRHGVTRFDSQRLGLIADRRERFGRSACTPEQGVGGFFDRTDHAGKIGFQKIDGFENERSIPPRHPRKGTRRL